MKLGTPLRTNATIEELLPFYPSIKVKERQLYCIIRGREDIILKIKEYLVSRGWEVG